MPQSCHARNANIESKYIIKQQLTRKIPALQGGLGNRKMIDGDGATGGDRSWGSKGGKQGDIITVESQAQLDRMQHDAPLYLGTLSSFANGCVERCNDPRTFHYRSAGTDVTVYIVDGVRSLLFTF